ncbi:hypothetical protein D9758_010827 [Tetrapyrgos nigripes]|uniref:Glucose-methanol-choline oxidoreductase N-terminal domain-containing protein n=1 Tax=Tetrapyrgos nigripes TaxID=182062 RepID=A0A8H5GIL4_9AGAR|nr:hypothetical protein D9758_010827 [Tetrapyrgos nigripes]
MEGSPKILELSGVGNSSILEAAGVQSVLELPSVGENLVDHAHSWANAFTNISLTKDVLNQNPIFAQQQLELWFLLCCAKISWYRSAIERLQPNPAKRPYQRGREKPTILRDSVLQWKPANPPGFLASSQISHLSFFIGLQHLRKHRQASRAESRNSLFDGQDAQEPSASYNQIMDQSDDNDEANSADIELLKPDLGALGQMHLGSLI